MPPRDPRRPATKYASPLSGPPTAALREIARTLSAASDLDTTLDLFAHKTTAVLGVDSCSIYLLDPEGTGDSRGRPDRPPLRLRASTGLARAAVGRVTLRVGEGLTGEAVRLGQPQFAREAQTDPRFKLIPETHEKSFRSLLAVPLLSQDRIIGALNVQTRRYHDFTPDEIELLSLVGDLAAGALEKASLHDSMQRQLAELTALARVSEAVTAPIYLDEMLGVVTEMAAKMMNAAVCSIFLVDDAGRNLILHSARPADRANRLRSSIPIGHGILGRAAKDGQPIASLDVRADSRYLSTDAARNEGLVSLLAVPLSVRERAIGVLSCYTAEPHEFSAEQIALLSTLANQTALAIENARLVTNAAMVREMHHRIKNNLQTVAMLLRMQIGDGRGLDARDALNESVNRILSIAAVHEVLSEQGFRLVDVKDVIERISRTVAQNMIPPEKEVRIAVEGEAVVLPSRAATALALVVNELLLNALEHAFVDRAEGEVRITLSHTGAEVVVEVADDGVGWPSGSKQKPPQASLGLEIVETLVREDLKGKLKFKRGRRGTQAIVRLPRTVE
ncbi:MAG: GAF domain-containing protein [Chloroflexi bacterium]|nr:GAF domain-containing protein [Chloroflexota bacterium]